MRNLSRGRLDEVSLINVCVRFDISLILIGGAGNVKKPKEKEAGKKSGFRGLKGIM